MRVYISGPYSKGNQATNVRNALEAGDRVWRAGHIPYVPHLTMFWGLLFPHTYREWLQLDLEWIKLCDIVIRLPGESSGADEETELARSLGIPTMALEEFLK